MTSSSNHAPAPPPGEMKRLREELTHALAHLRCNCETEGPCMEHRFEAEDEFALFERGLTVARDAPSGSAHYFGPDGSGAATGTKNLGVAIPEQRPAPASPTDQNADVGGRSADQDQPRAAEHTGSPSVTKGSCVPTCLVRSLAEAAAEYLEELHDGLPSFLGANRISKELRAALAAPCLGPHGAP